MNTPSSDKSALITGGTSGIGRAIALALADRGCRVTVTGVTDGEIDRFDASGLNIQARRLDVTNEGQIDALAGDLKDLDILINCAGIILREEREFEPANFAHVLDVNLTGTMRMCTACRPLLAASRGCIVNTASMLSFFGSGFVPAYSASKGGIAQLTKSLAIAWAGDGIRVNAIAPGWIETALTESLVADSERSRPLLERTPLGRWGQPEDIAGPVCFLCSPEAEFITGVVLPVDGGYSIA